MLSRRLAVVTLLSSVCFAGIVEDVRIAASQNDLSRVTAELDSYKSQHGVTPEYLEAMSWVARDSLFRKQLDTAETYARQAESFARQLLYKRPLDVEPRLPLALGAALEVQANVLAARGQQAQAAALLRRALANYGKSSIHARLQKNLNLLGLAGQPAPPLNVTPYLGVRPQALAQLKGSPVLLFFWAHWCSDCKNEGPIITRLRSEYAAKGLALVAPTQLYGYAAGGIDVQPKEETAYIGQIWQRYYSSLQDVAVPVSKANFDNYGASTTPTLVLLDRGGRVALYHPGAMSYGDLQAAIERTLAQ